MSNKFTTDISIFSPPILNSPSTSSSIPLSNTYIFGSTVDKNIRIPLIEQNNLLKRKYNELLNENNNLINENKKLMTKVKVCINGINCKLDNCEKYHYDVKI